MSSRFVSLIFGAVYLVIGVVGFAITGFENFTATNTNKLLLGFEVNPLHNVVHLAIGVVLLVASRSEAVSKAANTAIGLTYVAVGVAGLFLIDSTANILSLNYPDNSLHIATGIVLSAAGFGVVKGSRELTTSIEFDRPPLETEPDDLDNDLDEFAETKVMDAPPKRGKGRKAAKPAPVADDLDDLDDLDEVVAEPEEKPKPKKAAAKKKSSKKAAPKKAASKAPAEKPDDSVADADEASREDLYRRAQELGIPGRSTMDRNELARAIRAAEGG